MDSTEREALELLKSNRAEDTVESAPETHEDNTVEEEVEPLQEQEKPEVDNEDLDDGDEESDFFVEIDGKQISLGEIKESLGSKFRESDYTKKTQALAEERKAVEAKKAEIESHKKAFDEKLAELTELIKGKEESIDWDQLLEDDPAEYLRQKQKLSKQEQALQLQREERMKALESERAEYLNSQVSKMRELLPSWIDDKGQFTESANKSVPVIKTYLESKGFSSDDLGQVTDARLWAVFNDAAQYRAMKTKSPSVQNELKRAPKVLKPTKGRKIVSSDSDDARKKLASTGSEKDALAYLKSRRN